MYTKEEREGILWEFHRSGLSAPAACRSLPFFPNRAQTETASQFEASKRDAVSA